MQSAESVFDNIEDAIADIAEGKIVIIADDENRENEGDMIVATDMVTPEHINMMLKHARGLICVPMTGEQLSRLGLAEMTKVNRDRHGTAFTVSVDAAEGVTTGISAMDRWKTAKILGNPVSLPDQLAQPGHMFPLRARAGGVLERAGHTEATVDIARLAGLNPAGLCCEILNDDGSCSRLPQLVELKKKLGMKLVSVASLIEYRTRRERLVEELRREPFESEYGSFTLHVFRNIIDGRRHYALTMGELSSEPALVRMHSENLLSDVFAKKGLPGGISSTSKAMKRIAEAGCGAIVYLSHENAGLQVPERGAVGSVQPSPMDMRGYGTGAQILAELGLTKIRLLTSSPRRIVALDGHGLEIVEQIML
ncbi:MAG: 3,4-dihydroxy-2-butanone-4-phosphate synthase [Opitutales bacterium]|nr:3,4-dihydroxy-2-butanone-4-phosphate synthase [Opitutales bacterium]